MRVIFYLSANMRKGKEEKIENLEKKEKPKAFFQK